ncbi:MAG: J domain-containing protein, partial [Leptolyngbyaceae bacterium]|nr:J domain-containing protein [Leptolyngbyaceae bacterium]
GELGLEADMLIYTPKEGDRFLYTKPKSNDLPIRAAFHGNSDGSPVSIPTASPTAFNAPSHFSPVAADPIASGPTLPELMQRLQLLDTKLDALIVTSQARWRPGGTNATPSSSAPGTSPDQAQALATALIRQMQSQTQHQIGQHLTQYLSQQLPHQLAIAIAPLQQQLDDLQDQVENLADYVAELDVADFDVSPPVPQTDEEWLERINATWGTVGDYEKYSASYRDANAEAPLQETPDWIALCEFDWTWPLCPTLADLYQLIRGSNGVGDDGADILQQFGQHIDPKTGDSYYPYQLGGYSALDALRQIAHNPDHSWLPELKRLWTLLGDRNHPIFQLFGWEAEAIAALEHLVSPPRQNYGARSATDAGYSSGYRAGSAASSPTLRDYQAILNLGPFTPITIETIKRAYRQAMKAAHPDAGGSKEYAQQVNAAYAAVMAHYFPEVNQG